MHGRDQREIDETAREWRFREPEAMLLDEDRRVQWICDAKRRRLGEEESSHVIGGLCSERPGLCLHLCQECPIAEFDAKNRPSEGLSSWHVTRHTRQPVMVRIEAATDTSGGPLTRVRHIPQGAGSSADLENRMSHHALWASMSALTTGLAHEMRNPLLAMEMQLTALQHRPAYGLTDRGKSAVGDLLGLCHRMGGIIESLCAFSRPTPLRPREIDPLKVVQRALDARAEALAHIEVELTSELTGPIWADSDELTAAVGHLISNSADAMPDGGQLTIALTSDHQWCCIDVSDTGVGFPPSVLERFGQPFVSTKPVGKGAGLGLSLCQLTLERHAGRLVLLAPGPGGTKVRASLPMQITTEELRGS